MGGYVNEASTEVPRTSTSRICGVLTSSRLNKLYFRVARKPEIHIVGEEIACDQNRSGSIFMGNSRI